jgi:pimeloyl-ACP methyl ester carboxylesterase
MTVVTTATVHVRQLAGLYYEVRGAGPTLLLIPGSNGDAGLYDGLADALAERYTVVSYDRRGFSRSAVGEPSGGPWVEVHTEDARLLLQTVASGPSYVFGSSAGAVIGLALISRHPDLVAGLVAHEPPLAELLPDVAHWRELFAGVHSTYQRDGARLAMRAFMAGIDLDSLARPSEVDPALMGRLAGNLEYFLNHELLDAPAYRPDLALLGGRRERIVVAGGCDSRGQFAYRAAAALAREWGRGMVEFPGDHTGYWPKPAEFAAGLADALATISARQFP